ncbi:MAG: hypothetical protein ABSG25_03525 [Bryobacteraceae bacterium]
MPSFAAPQKSRVLPTADILSEFTARMEVEFHAGLERAHREANEAWSRAIRALFLAGTERDWARALLDAAQPFAGRCAVFLIAGENARMAGEGNLGNEPAGVVALAQAPAFASAVSSGDTVIALRIASELSPAAGGLLDAAPEARCCLIPIIPCERAVAILYADGKPMETSALEAVAWLAGATFGGWLPGEAPSGADWSGLTPAEQALHLRAQRFARVRAAEILLERAEAVHAGRVSKKLYRTLREPIDSGREIFRREFLATLPAMPDYFHWELVRTLANDDIAVLGEDYPGPLA